MRRGILHPGGSSERTYSDWQWVNDAITVVSWIVNLVVWWRKGNHHAPYKLRKGIAVFAGIGYLLWILLFIGGFALYTMNTAKNPGFFAAPSLAYYAGFAIFVFFLMVIVPGGILGYTMSHLVPEDPPWNRKSQGAAPNDQKLPYIVAGGSPA